MALAGMWLIGEAYRAWSLPGAEEGSYTWGYALRDVAYGLVVWVLMALGVVGVVFGWVMALRRLVGSMSSSKTSFESSNLFVRVERGASLLIAACLLMVGPLGWAWAVTTVSQVLSDGRLCGDGRAPLSEWLPIPHTRCFIEGQVVATSYVDAMFVAVAIAPIAWVVARALFRIRSQPDLETANF